MPPIAAFQGQEFEVCDECGRITDCLAEHTIEEGDIN